MKAFELVYNKEYRIKGQPSRIVAYKGQEGKKYWFKDIQGSFWMDEKQIENLLINL